MRPMPSARAPVVVLVDALDRETGRADRDAAHAGEGRLHRAISRYLFDRRGRVLLQKRSSRKALWPGWWSNACCTHPAPGESPVEAARRRAREELGLEVEPSYAFRYSYAAAYRDVGVEREVCHVFTAVVPDATPVHDPAEVEEVAWRDALEVLEESERDAGAFTPWFRIAYGRVVRALARGR
jgi:isopentenyl-diphosphate delta-isomerase